MQLKLEIEIETVEQEKEAVQMYLPPLESKPAISKLDQGQLYNLPKQALL